MGAPLASWLRQVVTPTQLTRPKMPGKLRRIPRTDAGFGPEGFGLMPNINPCSWPLASALTTPAI